MWRFIETEGKDHMPTGAATASGGGRAGVHKTKGKGEPLTSGEVESDKSVSGI
jgi:hypothetical protein